MLNPLDVIHHRLPIEAFTWANNLCNQAYRVYEQEEPSAPNWCLLMMGILEYEERRRLGIAHELTEGQPPLHWSDYTEERPYARPPGYQKSLKPAKNYRRRE